jgi:hypothetical protein
MASLATSLGSPRRGEAQGGDLAADDLAVGEISAGQGLPLLWVTDMWGIQIWVRVAFWAAVFFKRIKKMISRFCLKLQKSIS